MKIAILGAGAVGLGLAATLDRGGCPPRLVVRNSRTRAALESEGIHRHGLFGVAHVPPGQIELVSHVGELAGPPVEILLVCTKAFDTPGVAEAVTAAWPAGSTRPRIVFCQNGWGNERPFEGRWPSHHLFHARVITGFRLDSPTRVEITAHAQPLAVGSLFGDATTELRPLVECLSRGGLPSEISEDIDADLWSKMLYNCALNPLGALLGVSYGELSERHESRDILEAVVREIFGVLQATGHRTHWTNASDYLDTFYRELLPPTRRHRSSMLQDLRALRPTEIDALCGEVVKLGHQHGVETPVNEALRTLITAREKKGATAHPRP